MRKNIGNLRRNNEVMVVASTMSFSKTRQEEERITIEFQPTHARVLSGSGKEYVVTRNSCTCHDHFYRHTVCRHMQAVHNAVSSLKHW